jgi:hypothetical protein
MAKKPQKPQKPETHDEGKPHMEEAGSKKKPTKKGK